MELKNTSGCWKHRRESEGCQPLFISDVFRNRIPREAGDQDRADTSVEIPTFELSNDTFLWATDRDNAKQEGICV